MTTQTRPEPGEKAARQDTPARSPEKKDRPAGISEEQMDEDLAGTFPASDPPSSSVPETSVGWDDKPHRGDAKEKGGG